MTQGEPASFADRDEVGASRAALLVRLRLDHKRLDHPLGLDAGGALLDGLRRVWRLPRIARRLLQLGQRQVDDVTALMDDDGLLSHGSLLEGVGCRRKARLQPCPSARQGVQTEGRVRGEPAAGLKALGLLVLSSPKLGGSRSEVRRGRSPKQRPRKRGER